MALIRFFAKEKPFFNLLKQTQLRIKIRGIEIRGMIKLSKNQFLISIMAIRVNLDHEYKTVSKTDHSQKSTCHDNI